MEQSTMTNGANGDVRTLMTKFWKEHSVKADVTEMMLDSQAAEISDIELEEILQYLPDYEDKCVLELGAGIGRFTKRLAKSAKSVIAVDFMDTFIKKNKENNGHLEHVKWICNNVMDLSFGNDSLDVIFSNWLFMYLGDEDLHTLTGRMLGWLRPGGKLFFRESCYRKSGDKKRRFNPTIYRSPNGYTDLVTSVNAKKTENQLVGFDVVSSKSVETYIKIKNNEHQISWVMESAPREPQKNQGLDTFQKFLDQKQYTRNGILRYEMIFGQDYISTGGHGTTKQFCAMLGLKPGMKVLDVGCGIGGSAFHMSREYGAEVVGIDLSSNMIDIAIDRLRQYQIPKVSFEVGDATKIDYPEDSLDVAYSRDTILHIKDKQMLFQNIYKWLKPGGKLLITDYACGPHDEHSQEFKDYVKQRGYFLLTVPQYGEVLRNAGFKNVQAVDKTDSFIEILRNELVKFNARREEFQQKISEKDFLAIKDGWEDKLRRCDKGDQKWGLYYAEKKP